MKELETDPILGQTVLASKVLSSKGKGMGMGFSPQSKAPSIKANGSMTSSMAKGF